MDEISFVVKPHHRRPESIGGTKSPSNISLVEEGDHSNWHTIFGNMNAFQICSVINELSFTPENVTLICKFINGSRVKKSGGHSSQDKNKVELAWKSLFHDLTFEQIIAYINSVWLDPAYHFYIVKKTLPL